jgi:hypothetical protein
MPDTATQPAPIDIPGSTAVDVAPVTTPIYATGASNGVAMTPPPTELMASMHTAIASALTTLPPDKNGGLIALYSKNADGTQNANAVLVQKIASGPVDFNVLGWFGKTWKPNADGSLNFGAAIQVAW